MGASTTHQLVKPDSGRNIQAPLRSGGTHNPKILFTQYQDQEEQILSQDLFSFFLDATIGVSILLRLRICTSHHAYDELDSCWYIHLYCIKKKPKKCGIPYRNYREISHSSTTKFPT
jgi:hypothetical protein